MTASLQIEPPTWQMDDAYVSLHSPRYQQALKRIERQVAVLRELPLERDTLLEGWRSYDEALTILSSLMSFVKCVGAKDQTDPDVAPAMLELEALKVTLEAAAHPLEERLFVLSESDPLWEQEPLRAWRFALKEKRQHYLRGLSPNDAQWVQNLHVRVLSRLNFQYKALQKAATFVAHKTDGTPVTVGPARLTAILKGDPDEHLRRETAQKIREHYGALESLFADTLNTLDGLRLLGFQKANTRAQAVSLAQNRLSEAALNAIKGALKRHLPALQRLNSLRAPFFGKTTLPFEDLLAEPPLPPGALPVKCHYPYHEGIDLIKAALGRVHPSMSDFVDTLLTNRWVEAQLDEKKVGGAFYARFNELKMPRVFSTYVGTIHSVQQQAHEMGHAFHYWVMRDLPVVMTEFPMTLTETASTFNEALLRDFLLERAPKRERFAMLWQEMKSLSNMTLNIMARHTFELKLWDALEAGPVSHTTLRSFMREAWRDWYGESAEVDEYLWAHKLHFYKVDQLIYNYPYTVGYLLSLALLREFKTRGEAFYPFYVALLRDTGVMSVDDIVRVHFKADPTSEAFWENALHVALDKLPEFEALSLAQCPASC